MNNKLLTQQIRAACIQLIQAIDAASGDKYKTIPCKEDRHALEKLRRRTHVLVPVSVDVKRPD